MSATNNKNTKIKISGAYSTFTTLVPTAISLAKPAVVSLASVAGIAVGDPIKIPTGGTGFSELDGNLWVVGAVNTVGNTISLLGSNTVGSTGTLDATPTIQHAPASNMISLTCTLNEFTVNSETPGQISAATYCDPSAQISNPVFAAGNIQLRGNLDSADAGLAALLAAEADGLERLVIAELQNNGYLIAPVEITVINYEIPIDNKQSFTSQMLMKSKMRYRF